jgi:hypothetical protein
MRPLALEARVLAAVDARRSGVSPEDDFTECKRIWPEPKAARQLAALANRAAGEPIVYIIGLDDKTGDIVDPGATDPADWWLRMQREFDEVAPDWLIHLTVAIGGGGYVQAIAFDTSRVPYVIKTQTGRDVPMREGTRTRSASRSELLRLLLPSVRTPSATTLDISGDVDWREAKPTSASQQTGVQSSAQLSFYGDALLFLEHVGPTFVMLPRHGMRAWLRCEDWRGVLGVQLENASWTEMPASGHGVESRPDGVLATGPGTFRLNLHGTLPLERGGLFVAATHMDLTLELDVVGSGQPVRVDAWLARQPSPPAITSSRQKTLARYRLI